jgi:hypothetical protein
MEQELDLVPTEVTGQTDEFNEQNLLTTSDKMTMALISGARIVRVYRVQNIN